MTSIEIVVDTPFNAVVWPVRQGQHRDSLGCALDAVVLASPVQHLLNRGLNQ
jgi:hypothetical protein